MEEEIKNMIANGGAEDAETKAKIDELIKKKKWRNGYIDQWESRWAEENGAGKNGKT